MKIILKRLSRGVNNDNIVKHDTTVYQQDMTIQPHATIQKDTAIQPSMTIQHDTAIQPSMAIQHDMGVQQDTIQQNISDERSMFVDGTSLDIIYWNA